MALDNHSKISVCSRCVMNTSVPGISFDHEGCCNFCTDALERIEKETYSTDKSNLDKLIKRIKKAGDNKEYDCVIGISGGVDSSYVAHLVKDLGLRPIAVHLDNGWNSDLANSNINSLLDKLNIDLYTHVINWEEFKDLQVAFLKSSIANAEIPTDHAISALLFQTAKKHGIKYIIHGGNIATESIMPSTWMENAFDLTLLNNIHKKHGSKRLLSYPKMGLIRLAYYTLIRKIKFIGILNYISYDKEHAIKELQDKYNWKKYEAKHFESIFTRWFQGYFLPKKFKIDKRLAHYSSLIIANQLTREEALIKLQEPPLRKELEIEDSEYISKKLQLSNDEFQSMIDARPRSGLAYSKTSLYMNFFKKQLAFAKRKASNV